MHGEPILGIDKWRRNLLAAPAGAVMKGYAAFSRHVEDAVL
jgi:hypothetical protein